MSRLRSVLNFLCTTAWERQLAEQLSVNDLFDVSEFWLRTQDILTTSTRSIGFEYYESVARCHVLCVAAAPAWSTTWTKIVMTDLDDRLHNDQGLDAYTMGSQIGLFKAGKWLQEHESRVLDNNFLARMGTYCLAFLNSKNRAVNVSGEHNLINAQHDLDHAVKEYLRPKTAELRGLLIPDIHAMLLTLKRGAPLNTYLAQLGGHRSWLLNSLIHGALNIENRTCIEKITAAIALTTA